MIDIFSLIGTLGAGLIALAWIPETLRTLKTKETGLELKFILIYFFGSLSLTIYSIAQVDWIFIFLNVFATCSAVINLYYTIKEYHRAKNIDNYLKKTVKKKKSTKKKSSAKKRK